MKILYYDCFAGISGDMNLGAMIDLGVESEYLKHELSKLNIDDEFEIQVKKDNRKGISGTKVDVILCNNEHMKEYAHKHSSGAEHSHGHSHEHSQLQKKVHNHEHRNLTSIEKIIDDSQLNENIKLISKNIFLQVAKAEAKVHDKDLYEVHFHEVGATDSIVDIVGAAICIDYLKIDRVISSSVEVGSGFVKCAHGLMPVPAPATSEILTGIPIISGKIKYEATTPTGAAILASLVDEFTDSKDFIIEKTAYGIGNKDEEIPNVLRVFLAKKKLK
ncbi:TIGR00299 family protein [Clostridium grantii DSM 8605]|uniref:TIGR00299 family protein n=1 Tax=Clostridium grantii DSM 8605 TaxID=1121316 RepID=A0A1M5XT28_9CLOT|nr:TIGR00299 family protein [Clostridium grantii DSM 8605]